MDRSRYTLLAFALIASLHASAALAQQTGVWEVVDTTKNRYYIADPLASASADDHVLVSTGMGAAHIVLRTVDAGDSWQTLLSNDSPLRFYSVAHPVPDLIAIAGDSIEYLIIDGANSKHRYWGVMVISSDGGETWEKRVVDSNMHLISIAMASGQHGVMLANTVGNVYNEQAALAPDSLFLTTDAWRSHTTIALPPTILSASRVFMTQPGTIVVQEYDATSRKTYLHRSLDYGDTWTRSAPLPPLETISFTSPLDAWIAGSEPTGIGDAQRDAIAHSTDGGMSWTRLAHEIIGGARGGLMAIDFADAMNGIAVGRDDKILRTLDGGSTWRKEFVKYEDGRGFGFRAVSFPRVDRALVVSGFGPIFKYSGKQTLAPPTMLAPSGDYGKPVDSAQVEWTAIEGATQYRIQVASESVDNWYYDWTIFERSFVDTILTGTHLVLYDLEYWHRHYVRVMALNETQQSEWARGAFYTMKQGALPVPRILTPMQGALDQPVTVTFTWEPVPGARSYDLQVGTDRFFMDALTYNDSSITETWRVVGGLEHGTFYLARMRVRMPGGIGDWSASTAFRTTSDVSGVASNSSNAARRLSVTPNPVSGDALFVSISGAGLSSVELELLSALGESVRRAISIAGAATIPIDGLPAGIYFVRVVGDRMLAVQRVAIRR